MPDTREKLIKVLTNDDCPLLYMQGEVSNFADYLIKSGVTVQKWIPVAERLPNPFVSVLAYLPNHAPCPTVHECYISGDGIWCSAVVYGVENDDVTHWMPLPEPPKEGMQ